MTGYKSKRAMAQDKLAQPEFIKHEVENSADWSEWVCPERDDCDVVDDPVLQAVFRMRRSEEWTSEDTAHRAGGLPMDDPNVREWVYLTEEHIKEIVGPYALPIIGYTRKLFDQIEAKSKELNT